MPVSQLWVIWHNILPVTLGNIVGGIGILILHPNRIRQLVMLWQPERPVPPTGGGAGTPRPTSLS